MNRKFCMVILVVSLLILCVFHQWELLGFYNGLNKGIYFMNCGLEIVGNPGFFCGNY